jgi:glyoxylase-like metal-dependent hydrolase (beta-lactamase superfamily II)
MQILPGVYLINGSPYGRHQNGYLVHREGATLLIDSGDLEDAETLPEVERNAARWGFRLEAASHLLVTHAHFDHASHAAELQRRGVQIVASPETAEAMAAGDERCIGYAVQRVFPPCRVDAILRDGQELTVGGLRVRCLAAPGHTDGLVVYEIVLEGERAWFVGDLLEAMHAHRWVSLPWTGAPDFDRARYIRSLARLLQLPPCDHLLPGHGPPAIGGGKRLLEMAYTEALLKWR